MFQREKSGIIGFTGVCWKLSKASGVNANFFRAAFIIGALVSKAVLVTYLFLWAVFFLTHEFA